MSAKVYQYGITRMPDRLQDHVFEQAIKRHKFYNALIAMDKQYTERWQRVVAESDEELLRITADLAGLELSLADALALVSKSRAENGGKATKESQSVVKDLRSQLREARAAAKERKAEARLKAKPSLDALEEERRASVKAARQNAASDGLYWGNYNAVIDKFNTARQSMLKKRSQGQPCDLRFQRWDGSAAWTVQIIGGASWEDITTGRCQMIQVDAVQSAAFDSASRGERRRLARTKGRIRIGSNEDRSPVWLEFPVTIHRPIPETARIKMAHVVRKKYGLRWEWNLNIVVVDSAECPQQTGPAVAVHFGFRRDGNSIRVGTIYDGSTYTPIEIPYSTVKATERTEGLRSVLDGHVNELREEVAAWVKENAPWTPEWLAENTKGMHQWRAPWRFVRLLDTWDRFAGDEDIFARIDAFRKRYRHLYQWQSDLQRKITLRRREAFRVAAASIADRAGVVYLDDADYAAMARRPAPEDSRANEVEAAIRHMARAAAPAELRAEIERACASRNVPTARIDPADITRQCCHCGNVAESGELGAGVRITCPACGVEHDRDNNAVRNVWMRGAKTHSQNAA